MREKYICHIGPGEEVLGGISTVISYIMNSFLKEEFRFTLIRSAAGSKKIRAFLKSLFNYIGMCLKKQVVCAHIHMSENGSCYRTIVFIYISRIFNNKIIIHSHGGEFEQFYRKLGIGIKKKVFDLTFQKVNAVIVLTLGSKKFWNKIVPDEKIIILPNAVVIPEGSIKRNREAKVLKVLFLGKLGERKGTYDLIESISMVAKRGIHAELYLAGDGEIEKCQKRIRGLRLEDQIRVCGWVGKEKKDNLLRTCDLLALPSVYESFGIVLLEAMSYRIPVICSDGGYMHEIIEDGKDGYIVPVHNPCAIAEYIIYFASHRERLIEMGEFGYQKVVSQYSYQIVMNRLRNIYYKILK